MESSIEDRLERVENRYALQFDRIEKSIQHLNDLARELTSSVVSTDMHL